VVKRHPGVNFHGLDSWAVTPAPLVQRPTCARRDACGDEREARRVLVRS
jgi:hypothetical protein